MRRLHRVTLVVFLALLLAACGTARAPSPLRPLTLQLSGDSNAAASLSAAGLVQWLDVRIHALLAPDVLQEARQRALEAGSYRYETEIRQTMLPRPLPELIGQCDQQVSWRAEGQVQLPDQATTTILIEGADPVNLIRAGQRTFLKQGDTIHEVQDPNQLTAPSADVMSYLDAAKNVRELEPQSAGGVLYSRFAFEIDGPRFAEQVRQQIERELAGEMPEGGHVSAPRILQLMTGTGELWVDEDGLPRRQVLDLHFLQATEAYDAQVHMVTDFRNYGQPQAMPALVQAEDGAWRVQESQPAPDPAPVTGGLAKSGARCSSGLRVATQDVMLFLILWLLALVVRCYRRHRRRTYAAVVVVVLLVLVVGPPLQMLSWVRFYDRQAKAASVDTLGEALGLSTSAAEDPLGSAATETTDPALESARLQASLAAATASRVSGGAASRPAVGEAATASRPAVGEAAALEGPPQCGDGSPDQDTDGDGLNDFAENCYGTDAFVVDSDRDLITDTLEIQGLDWGGRHWTGNALLKDSNADGLPDAVEWPAPVGSAPGWDPDSDGVPNVWDDDNDDDGVPDGFDFSPYSVGAYRDANSLEVWDAEREGHQYIEFQLQPQITDHLRYTTTYLDWPDNDTKGQITSPITGTQDMRLLPFLDVETEDIPEEDLRTHYGLALMEEAGKTPHLLIPLMAQTNNGATSSFYGKVAYGPEAAARVLWTNARLVWLVQTVYQDGKSGIAHTYVERYRFTGMQITKSEGYELGFFGTPDSVLEDAPLASLLFRLSATFLEYGELEGQSDQRTVLQEVVWRIGRPEPGPLWDIGTRVAASLRDYGHQDQVTAESGAQVKTWLDSQFARDQDLCTGADGNTFECAATVVASEERLAVVGVDDLGPAQVYANVTDEEALTQRNLRYQMYERVGSAWQTASIARTMEIVEQRYAGHWDEMLAPFADDYPYLEQQDLRFATWLFHEAWHIGRAATVKSGDVKLVPPAAPADSILVAGLGIALSSLTNIPEFYLQFTDLARSIDAARALPRLKYLASLDPSWSPLTEGPNTVYSYVVKTAQAKTQRAIAAVGKTVVALATVGVGVANAICGGSGSCSKEDLKALSYATKGIEAVGILCETIDVVAKAGQWASKGLKGIETTFRSASKAAKVLAVAGLVLELAVIWTQFGLAISGGVSGFAFSAALGTAIVATIFAIVIFILMEIPGVNVVVGVVLILVAIVDLLLWALGIDFSVMGAVMSFFYRAEMLTKAEKAGFVGGGSALQNAELGFVAGNLYELWDTFEATITGSYDSDTGAYAQWAPGPISLLSGIIGVNSASQKQYISGSELRVRNDVRVKIRLGQRLLSVRPRINEDYTIPTKIHLANRYKECTLWWICWHSTDHQDIWDKFTVTLDVLPRTLSDLWGWSALRNPDPDGDGLNAAAETAAGTNAALWDSDGDGLSDGWEAENQSRLGTNPTVADSDGDGLSDGREIRLGTSPREKDSDSDGLPDDEEVAGLEVRVPGGGAYWVFSDPLQADADGDLLNDAMEKAGHTSPYAPNVAPGLLAAALPRSASPGGELGTYVAPGDAVRVELGVVNTASQAVTTTLSICLSGDHLADSQVVTTGGSAAPLPPTETHDCGPGRTGFAWNFNSQPLHVGESFTATLTAQALGPSGTGVITCELPFEGQPLSHVLEVVVDDDVPVARLIAPLDGELLTRERYVIGGSAVDPSSWAEEIDLLIDGDPGTGVVFGTPVDIGAAVGPWAYTWSLPADGVYALATRARDPFAHASAQQQIAVRVDNTPPAATMALAGGSMVPPVAGRMVIIGTASDNLTGLSRVQVSVDAASWQEATMSPPTDPAAGLYPLHATWTYSWTVNAEAQGSHTVATRALDHAGNMGTVQRVEFVLDAVPPSDDLLTRLGGEAPIVAANQGITLTGYANDAGNVPLSPRPAALHGELDAIADATVWLSPESIDEDDAGVSMAWIGDMDGDGRADLAMGLPASEDGAGKVVVLYGRYGDWKLPPDAQALAEEWTAFVGAEGAGLGARTAPAGDVDGDGLDDLLVGDPANRRAFLIYGQPYPLGSVTGPGIVLDGPAPGRHTVLALAGGRPLGELVAPAGDANGDGYGDFFIGTADTAYLVLGHGVPWLAEVEVGAEAAAVVALPPGGRATGVGDVDGDQYDDWVVTRPAGSPGVYLLPGSPGLTRRSAQIIAPGTDALAFLPGNGFGAAQVVALGDVNGDELADFLYSGGAAPRLVLGKTANVTVSLELSGYSPAPDGFLAAPGDVDADGKDDLLLGTSDHRAYLILGRSGWTAPPEIKATLMGVAGAASAPFAASADLNCDRSADLLLLPDAAEVSQLQAAERPFGTAVQLDRDHLLTVGSPTGLAPAPPPQAGASGAGLPVMRYVDDGDHCAGSTPCYDHIQAAVDAAAAGDAITVYPGLYEPFALATGKDDLTIAGTDPDAVFVDGQGGDYAVDLTDVEGVSLSGMTLRNAVSLVRLTNAGAPGVQEGYRGIVLDQLLGYGLTHALSLDGLSSVAVRRCTWVTGQSGQAILWVDPDTVGEPLPPEGTETGEWESLSPMSAGREAHTTTLLPDGRVLVAGGICGESPVGSAELYNPKTGAWTPTGSMSTARHWHTATLLPDGRVLVAGGYTPSGTTNSAELYDPATGTWGAAASMAHAREIQTATLLPSGRVLVVGGQGPLEAFASAELYSPATDTWTVTGNLATGRRSHTATLLPDGKVLVAGGSTSSGTELASAELYNPAAGTWTATAGSMTQARESHTATLLSTGRVLVAGGFRASGGNLSSAELYDPATGSWTPTAGSMALRRAYHAATLLPDGRVLVTGGYLTYTDNGLRAELYDPVAGTWAFAGNMASERIRHTATVLPDGRMLVAGGYSAAGCLASVERYDLGIGRWEPTGRMYDGRSQHTATLLADGRVLVAGGRDSDGEILGMVELYDPATGKWSTTGYLATPRAGHMPPVIPNGPGHTATLLRDGRVLVVGGLGYGGGLDSAELYDPATGVWTATGSMAAMRAFHTATMLPDGRVLVAGGWRPDWRYGAQASAEVYNPATGTWTPAGSMAAKRYTHTATLLRNGKVLVAGGWDDSGGGILASAEVYDPATGTWTPAASNLSIARAEHTALLLSDGRTLVTGGWTGYLNYTASAELYDPATATWSPTSSMIYARHLHTLTLLPDGRALVAGGQDSTYYLATAELYDPGTGVWSGTAGMASMRSKHTATLLPDGTVLVAGGNVSDWVALATAELYTPVTAPPERLIVEDTALVAKAAVAAPTWLNVELRKYTNLDVVIRGSTQWVADQAWAPTVAATATVLLQDARFLDPDHDVYRIATGSALASGYATVHEDAYVSPAYCEGCANDGRVWGVTAFHSIQAAIDNGAPRVMLLPGIYQETFHLVSGLRLIGSGAEMTFVLPPLEASGGTLVTGEGVAAVIIGGLTLNGQTLDDRLRLDGLRIEDGARAVSMARNIIRGTNTAIALHGAATEVEIVNNTLVGNQSGVVATGCATVDLRNTILADHSAAALSYERETCEPEPGHIHRYNAYWHNGDDLRIDGVAAIQPGTGEIAANPRFTDPVWHDYRPLATSPAIDAGNPSDPIPPGTGERVDIGYIELGQAAFAVDDDYCATCLNDGLTWGVNAFAHIQDALDAADALVRSLGEALVEPPTVGVGPGRYREPLLVPSRVRLIGIGADEVTVESVGVATAVTANHVHDVEIRGLHITASGAGRAGIQVMGTSRDVLIARNLIEGNGDGVVFEGKSTGRVSFCTIGDQTGAGLMASGKGSWIVADNNILAENRIIGLVAENEGQILSDYNLVYNGENYQGVTPGTDDIVAVPGFAGGSRFYHLRPDSPAVDTANPAESVPVGGGKVADRGYWELRAVPMTLLFGQQGTSCAEGNSGVAAVEVALVHVVDASAAITETLPAAWMTATLETAGQVASYWSAKLDPAQDGLQRIYTRATDMLGNRESDPLDWYSGAMLVDSTPPEVVWVQPTADMTTGDITLLLRATASDWLDAGAGAGQRFTVAQVYFEANGRTYLARWADDGWSPVGGQPRTFEAWVPLWEGNNQLYAVATDLAGHVQRSAMRKVTSTTSGNAAAIVSIDDAAATNQGTLAVSGHARFVSAGAGQVTVQVDSAMPVLATLSDPAAAFTAWSVTVTLSSEGWHTITAIVVGMLPGSADGGSAQLDSSGVVHILLDLTAPTVEIEAPDEGDQVQQQVTLQGNASDGGSGMQRVQVSLDGGILWQEAALETISGEWSCTWTAPTAQSGVTYVAQVRASDKAGNVTTVERSFVVDSEPPQGLQPLTFNIPVGTHLDSVQELSAGWEPAVDASGQVTVTAAIDQLPATAPGVVMLGQNLTASLNANGSWYFHLLAQDEAGNGILYHEGPWYVGLNDATVPCGSRRQSILLDGALDVAGGEWLANTEQLDTDDGPASPQTLYLTWDATHIYLGWDGAQWDAQGTLWAYLDTSASGGSTVGVGPAEIPALPFTADLAVQVDGAADGTLWRYTGGAWISETLEFAASGEQVEARVPWSLTTTGMLRLLAFALTDEGAAWAAFPTNNPLVGPSTTPYVWPNPCDVQDRKQGQPTAINVALNVSSNLEGAVAWGNNQAIAYRMQVENRDPYVRSGLSLRLAATDGLGFQSLLSGATCISCPSGAALWMLALPELAANGTHTVTLTARTAALGVLTEVAVSASVPVSLLPAAEHAHRADGLPPELAVNLAAGEVVQPGLITLSGTSSDGTDGSGVTAVVVGPAGGPLQAASGLGSWSAQLTIPAETTFALEVRATDAASNTNTVQRTLVVDSVPPVITWTVPGTLTGLSANLEGTARDPWPVAGRVTRVEVQLDDEHALWHEALGPYAPGPDGTQSWLYTWGLPADDGMSHRLRARAFDGAGNVGTTAWVQTWVDTVAPALSVEQRVYEALLPDYAPGAPAPAPVLVGQASDGGGAVQVRVRLRTPLGDESVHDVPLATGQWQFTPLLDPPVAGNYRLRVEATDISGNLAEAGPFILGIGAGAELYLPLVLRSFVPSVTPVPTPSRTATPTRMPFAVYLPLLLDNPQLYCRSWGYAFREEFLDPRLPGWNVSLATGAQEISEDVIHQWTPTLTDRFPMVWRNDLFAGAGNDFLFEARFRYSNLTAYGTTVALNSAAFDGTRVATHGELPSEVEYIMNIHHVVDAASPANTRFDISMFGGAVKWVGTPGDTNWHQVQVTLEDGDYYSLYVDGAYVGSAVSTIRPTSVYIGNPTIQRWSAQWSQIYVDYIRISRCLVWGW